MSAASPDGRAENGLPGFLGGLRIDRSRRLRELLSGPDFLMAPGAADPLTARLIEEAGFPICYVTGAGIANQRYGMADVGLTTGTEIVDAVRAIATATALPTICDADTGYGNAINVMRTVHEFERAGAAGIQLEDQVTPKRCGHFAGKDVIDAVEMVQKIRAAVAARSNPDFIIVARTDARAVHGLDEALARARAFRDAGADVLFVEAPKTIEEMARIPAEVPGVPHLANMVEGGRTPILPAADLAKLGFKIAIYANFCLRVAARAIQEGLVHLAATGSSAGYEDRMISMTERQRLVSLPQIEQLEQRYLSLDFAGRPVAE
ncbi:MAG TPA: isocitrate lyase/PEP mutase family protein [Dehalococcoidia bacterium]|nr:isocitrate lyase/PEP mutase family protein [Dehalococcoidia bacterium]